MTFVQSLKLCLASLILIPAAAGAQFSVYAAPTLTGFGLSDSNSISFKTDSGGLTVGGFYNFPIQSRLTAGIDLRDTYSFGSNGGDFAGVALRIGFVPHKVRLRPYFQLGGGFVSTTGNAYALTFNPTVGYLDTVSTQRYTNGAVELVFGLDIRLTDHIDLRAFDYGAAAGASNSNTTAALGFLDAGIVYHFRPR
jgi:hypothetical protein